MKIRIAAVSIALLLISIINVPSVIAVLMTPPPPPPPAEPPPPPPSSPPPAEPPASPPPSTPPPASPPPASKTTTTNKTTTTDTTPPTITELTISNITASGATISWKTGEASTTVLQFGVTKDYGQTSTQDGAATEHSLVVTDLQPETTYYIKAESADAMGNLASQEQSFTTAKAEVVNEATKEAKSQVSEAGSPAWWLWVIPGLIGLGLLLLILFFWKRRKHKSEDKTKE